MTYSNALTRDKNTKRHTIRELAGKNELPLIAFVHELHGFGPSSHNLSSLAISHITFAVNIV